MIEKIRDWFNGIVITGGAIVGEMIAMWDWQVVVWIITSGYGILQIIYMIKRIRNLDDVHNHNEVKHDSNNED